MSINDASHECDVAISFPNTDQITYTRIQQAFCRSVQHGTIKTLLCHQFSNSAIYL